MLADIDIWPNELRRLQLAPFRWVIFYYEFCCYSLILSRLSLRMNMTNVLPSTIGTIIRE